MLEIDLRTLGSEGTEIQETLDAEDGLWSDTDLEFAEAPRVDLRVTEAGERDVHVRGDVTAALRLSCRRCLRDVEAGIALELDLLFDPEVGTEGEQEQVYRLEAEGGILDLRPAIREQLLLEVPPYPLCAEDCEGLCPKCGIDRNRASCDCTLEEPDPRWEALRELQPEE